MTTPTLARTCVRCAETQASLRIIARKIAARQALGLGPTARQRRDLARVKGDLATLRTMPHKIGHTSDADCVPATR